MYKVCNYNPMCFMDSSNYKKTIAFVIPSLKVGEMEHSHVITFF